MKQRAYAAAQTRAVDEQKLTVDIIASTPAIDSHGTVIDPDGWDVEQFKRNPVITWAHDDRGFTGSEGLPIANAIPETVRIENGELKMRLRFTPQETNPFGYKVFRMIKEGFIHGTSVGFNPQDSTKKTDRNGNLVEVFTQSKLLEVAIVTIPSNDEALIQSRSRQPAEVARFKQLAQEVELEAKRMTNDPIRWNRSLGKGFDVTEQWLEPAALEYDWVSRHIGCDVKKVFQNSFNIPAYRIGGVLLGLRHAFAGNKLEEVRNLTWGGTELPPEYNVIELNSTRSEDFLINGLAFYKGQDGKFAYRIYPIWNGLHVDLYTHVEAKEFSRTVVDKAWRYAKENNPLKGEAFSLSGEFIRMTDEGWDDCFLEEQNKKALKRVVDRLNEKGKATPNRGLILTGPPGTGKTLSGRIVRNHLKDCSFIWLSARDFWYGGGFTHAFELAREISPSVLFLEDIDNWITRDTIDLLKTEMDGIARSTGVVTVLTTNFPERLPEALIDRPGRFHDVLHFNVPTEETRKAMLAKWVEGLDEKSLDDAAKKTEGYSGAHMYELASFARNLQESDELPVAEAMTEALRKVEEQKDLITQLQLSGSNYRPHRFIAERNTRFTLSTTGTTISATEQLTVEKSDILPAMPDTPPESAPAADSSTSDAVQVDSHEEYVQKCISYFERKQKPNRESTKVLKRFFEMRGEEPPAEEEDAWKKMGECIDQVVSLYKQVTEGEQKTNVENDTSGHNNVENERGSECDCGKEDCDVCNKKKKKEGNVEDENDHNNVEDERAAEPTQTSQPQPVEAPQVARKASVQIPLPVLLAFSKGLKGTFREASAEALRQGKSSEATDAIIAALEERLLGEVSRFTS